MNDREKASEVLDFTFDYLDKVLNEKSGGSRKKEAPSGEARLKSGQVKEKGDRENCTENSSWPEE